MSANIFPGSSILVEYVKNRRTDLLDELIIHNHTLFINGTVISEFLYHYLCDVGGKSPRTLKGNNQIPALMQQYNLLPNDAQILAVCRQRGFRYLSTYDPDFALPCQQEAIQVIDSLATLTQLFPI